MPDRKDLIINTGPIIAIVAALNDLRVLEFLYHKVLVPFEVCQEIEARGITGFAVPQFIQAEWLHKWSTPLEISSFLLNSLDRGEAAVIQMALTYGVSTVCIDESAGRRIARLHELSLTGSIGILLRAKKEGYPFTVRLAIDRMRDKGIWLSERVIKFALDQAGESSL